MVSIDRAIARIIMESPIRLVRAVSIPALSDLLDEYKVTRRKDVSPSPSHPIRIAAIFGIKIKSPIDMIKAQTR